MKPSATILLSLLMLPLLSGCAVEEPTSEPESITGTVLENNAPDLMLAGSVCEGACANYVNKCLTLVPGATQQIFNDGQVSCLQECDGWDTAKIECILNAQNCTSMTEECAL